jgi:hypothetical protein
MTNAEIPMGRQAARAWKRLDAGVRKDVWRCVPQGTGHPDPAVAAIAIGRARYTLSRSFSVRYWGFMFVTITCPFVGLAAVLDRVTRLGPVSYVLTIVICFTNGAMTYTKGSSRCQTDGGGKYEHVENWPHRPWTSRLTAISTESLIPTTRHCQCTRRCPPLGIRHRPGPPLRPRRQRPNNNTDPSGMTLFDIVIGGMARGAMTRAGWWHGGAALAGALRAAGVIWKSQTAAPGARSTRRGRAAS